MVDVRIECTACLFDAKLFPYRSAIQLLSYHSLTIKTVNTLIALQQQRLALTLNAKATVYNSFETYSF